ncbi:MAG TPA: FliM/FliN family flagellar motor switch protein [Elusimicrobiota bacterium]|nr:FliM/FliN family flagellar motor switch protein [Elusimicrobiota bacterium]HMX93835.1 FliM/FliN family flagellar motor switch protein [Elusimicrobiota bacterium]HMZ26887.1 FliM/FliN family flagellar motor switch protein [Elusimicrobiota bacterium]HNC73480.1 FliM/FliN family flagellar motor switch protein [Elusimicrobiota bacterium]HNG45142.1 FliM/FliN family flagellar motor switch protein [Elusimicrobiota bacterium]
MTESSGVQRFDPRRGGGLVKATREQLARIHKEFTLKTASTFPDRLGLPLRVTFRDLATIGWDQCQSAAGASAAVLPFALTPGDGFGFLRLSADGARAFVDASFGGPGRSGPGGAPLTDVERRSAVWPLRLFLTEWNALWEAFGECAFNADEIGGADAHFSSAAGEPHVVAGFDWSIGETTGRLEAALPLSFARPFLGELEKARGESNALWTDPKMRPVLRQRAEGVSLPLRVCLVESDIPVRDMADLEVGDVVRLGSVNQSAVVKIGEISLFHAKAGVSNGRLAVRVLALAGNGRSAS